MNSDYEGPEQWGRTRCTTCGHYPPCQCPGNPFGTGTGLNPETFPEPGTYVGPAFPLDNEQDARIYATARVDALEAALKASDVEGIMAVYRQMVADGYADAAENMMRQIIAAGLENLAGQLKRGERTL